MNHRGVVCAVQQNPQGCFNQYKVPVMFSQRSAQTPTRPVSQECGGSFYTPPQIANPRRLSFPSWARISGPTTPSILPIRMNHSIFRMGYIIPDNRGPYPDVYTGRLDLHEYFLNGNEGPLLIRIGVRYETTHRVVIEIQSGGSFSGAFQLLSRINNILNPIICRIRSLPAGTQFTFDIPFP